MARTFQGKHVSEDWYWVLNEAWRQGVRFQLNSGQRTMAEQWALYRNPPPGTPVVAFPNPNAPHIRVGRQNHAIDVDTNAYAGGEQHLQNWLIKHGIPAVNNVAREAWHIDPVDGAALHRAAVKFGAKQRRLQKYRQKAAELRANITKRQKAGKASPGQRKLLKAYNRMIRKLKRR